MRKHILLCDDEPYILRAAQYKLSRSGFEVHNAYDGEDAWRQMQQIPPDLLITDCQMPNLDGIGLIKRMREDESYSDIPVVMLTAKGYELSAQNLRDEYNVHSLLAKPFSPKELVQLAATIIETHAPRPIARAPQKTLV